MLFTFFRAFPLRAVREPSIDSRAATANRLCVTASLFACIAATAFHTANGATPENPQALPKNISIEFTAVAWERSLNDIEVRSGKVIGKLELPAFAQSKAYHYSGPNPMVLTRFDKEYADSHPDYKPVSKDVSVPSGWTRVILLVAPTPDGSFAVKAVRDDVDDFPLGSVRIMNVSGEPLAIKAGDKSQLLPPQENAIFPPQAGENQLGFIYARQEENTWKPMGSDVFPINQAQRRTVFITKSDAELFQRYTQWVDEKGNIVTSKLPARAFQIFTIIDTVDDAKP